MKQISDNGLQLIAGFEGLRLNAYFDAVGVLTIGYGHTQGVKRGDTITKKQALDFLRDDAQTAVNAVNQLVKVNLTQNQFDALVSLVFNIGAGNFKSSRLLKFVNVKQFKAAADAFKSWNKGRINGKLTVLKGLTIRRGRERELFLS